MVVGSHWYFWFGAACLFIALSFATKGVAALQAARSSALEAVKNLILWLANGWLYALLGIGLIAQLIPALHAWKFPNIWVPAFVAFLALELVDYWLHRLRHCRWLWPVHKTHHSDRRMTWTTIHRKHPLDYALTRLCEASFLTLIGIPLWVAAPVILIRAVYIAFVHADLPWSLGPLRYVLISPLAHRYHHALDEHLAGSNFGGVLSIFDRMFGTYIEPDHRPETGVGYSTSSGANKDQSGSISIGVSLST